MAQHTFVGPPQPIRGAGGNRNATPAQPVPPTSQFGRFQAGFTSFLQDPNVLAGIQAAQRTTQPQLVDIGGGFLARAPSRPFGAFAGGVLKSKADTEKNRREAERKLKDQIRLKAALQGIILPEGGRDISSTDVLTQAAEAIRGGNILEERQSLVTALAERGVAADPSGDIAVLRNQLNLVTAAQTGDEASRALANQIQKNQLRGLQIQTELAEAGAAGLTSQVASGRLELIRAQIKDITARTRKTVVTTPPPPPPGVPTERQKPTKPADAENRAFTIVRKATPEQRREGAKRMGLTFNIITKPSTRRRKAVTETVGPDDPKVTDAEIKKKLEGRIFPGRAAINSWNRINSAIPLEGAPAAVPTPGQPVPAPGQPQVGAPLGPRDITNDMLLNNPDLVRKILEEDARRRTTGQPLPSQ